MKVVERFSKFTGHNWNLYLKNETFSSMHSPNMLLTRLMVRLLSMLPLWTLLRWMVTNMASCLFQFSLSPRCYHRMLWMVCTSSLFPPVLQPSQAFLIQLIPLSTSAVQRTTSAQSMPSARIQPYYTSANVPPTTLTSPTRWILMVCTPRLDCSTYFCSRTFLSDMSHLSNSWYIVELEQ